MRKLGELKGTDAWGWPWSSASVHTAANAVDAVLSFDWIGKFDRWDYGEWKELLSVGAPGGKAIAGSRTRPAQAGATIARGACPSGLPLSGKRVSQRIMRLSPFSPDAIQHPSKAWLAVIVTVLLACLFVGLKFLESFLIYSFQAGGLDGSSAYREKYDIARAGQLLTLVAFVASQMIGGTVLRTMLQSHAVSWGERIKSVLLHSVGFAVITAMIVGVIAFLR
jgi:hypothetical protein